MKKWIPSIAWLGFAAAAILVTPCRGKQLSEEPGDGSKPNIILILADDLGNADLGFAGSDLYQSPNLDRFAGQGMYFSRACASHPTCQPSRIALQTGKFPARVGAVSHGSLRQVAGKGNELPAEEVTIGQALKMAGYSTCHIGKWHVGTGENSPLNRGYDFDIASNEFCCPPSYFYPFTTTQHGDYRDAQAAILDLDGYKEGDNLTDALTDQAVGFIKGAHDKPFFLNLSYYAVHTPLQTKPELKSKYKARVKKGNRHRNPVYAGMIETLDDGVGRILAALEEKGIADNTVVVFTSDNGGAKYNNITDNHPLRDGKGSSYEGGYRVPMIVRWPGVTEPGQVCDERVIGYDLYPTFLSMAGGEGDEEHNKNVDGVDLSPLLKGANARLPEREFHFVRWLSLIHFKVPIVPRNRCVETMIKGDWKLMEFLPMPDGFKGHLELYNLKDDPSEEKNLAEEMPEKARELKAAMKKWRGDVNVPRYDMEKFYGHVKLEQPK